MRKNREPDRENKHLIDIVSEGKIKNTGGFDLYAVTVPIEDWSYEVREASDMWSSEYIFEYVDGCTK